MRVLLDECLPRRLRGAVPDHKLVTVPDAGWAAKSNGDLLGLASGQFDVFVTVDQNLPAQQDLSGLQIGVIILLASSNRFQDLEPLASELTAAIETIQPGEVVRLGG
jgi:hypothetical protein